VSPVREFPPMPKFVKKTKGKDEDKPEMLANFKDIGDWQYPFYRK
jgi:hypothetical protein